MFDEGSTFERVGALHEWLKGELTPWVKNAHSRLEWMSQKPEIGCSDKILIPVTLHPPPAKGSLPGTYITSLKCGWFDYLAQELHEHPVLGCLIRCLGVLAKTLGLENLIVIGNLPISTNLMNKECLCALPSLSQQIRLHHPKHFLAVRNLLPSQHASTIEALKEMGFYAIPQRVVYHFDLRSTSSGRKPSHLQRDLSLLKKSGLKAQVHQQITRETADLICLQYQQIYIEKHSPFNANYTPDFFYAMTQCGAFQCLTLCDSQDKVLAFAMLYACEATLSVPALGYETKSEISSLYRMLFASIWLHTQNSGKSLNYSSGAGDFKRKRGGIPELEYTLISPPQSRLNYKSRFLKSLENMTRRMTAQDLIEHGA